MIGDATDMAQRLRLTLPDRWFADAPSVLQGLTAGLGAAWACCYELLQSVKQQTRLATTSGSFLDVASDDLFGGRLPRLVGEGDDAFKSRIQKRMHRRRGTRAAVIAAAAETGCTIQVFEPARIADTGAYATPGNLAWGVAGGWGSLTMPLESLIAANLGSADPAALKAEIVDVLPAGGVAWLRTSS